MNIKGRFTPEEIEELARRYKDGQSMAKISRKINRTEFSIRKHLVNLDLFKTRKANLELEEDNNFWFRLMGIRIGWWYLLVLLPIISVLMILCHISIH